MHYYLDRPRLSPVCTFWTRLWSQLAFIQIQTSSRCAPTSVTEPRWLLGMVNHLAKFAPHIANHVRVALKEKAGVMGYLTVVGFSGD